MPEVIRTKNSLLLLLLLSIHFYEKVGNVELELTAQIIFTSLLLSRSLLLLMNELQCYSLSASSSKRYDTCFFIQPALLKFETIHWVIAPKRCTSISRSKGQLYNLSPKFSCTKQQKHVNKLKYSLPRKSYWATNQHIWSDRFPSRQGVEYLVLHPSKV
jgi:hypothetical protein